MAARRLGLSIRRIRNESMPTTSPHAHHWGLDPAITFLNHGSFGACPTSILALQREWQDRLERQPVGFFVRELEPELDRTRACLGELLHCDADDLALIPNATTGVNTVLRSLRFESGDELLVTDHEYNACRMVLDYVAARAGARIVVVPVAFAGYDPQRVVRDLTAAVTDRTRLVLIDHITSPTALIMPVRDIVHAMNERGVDVLVDGAHGPGHIPLDLGEIGAAYYTGNCHKWLCTPKGAALLHVRRDRQDGLRPLVISHGANSPRQDRSRFRLEADWTGTADPTPLLCIPAAIEFLSTLMPGGLEALQRHNHSLAVDARRALCDALDIDPPCGPEHLGNMAALPLPTDAPMAEVPSAADPLYDRLVERGFEVPIFQWPALGLRLVRISAQAYNTLDQFERLGGALRTELRPLTK